MGKTKEAKTITIFNIKGSNFRQVHVDGAHGTITPSGLININFFSQRNAIPKGTIFSLNEDGTINKPIKDIEDSKNGIIRDFEFGIIMDAAVCESIRNFLDQKLNELESIQSTKEQ